MVQRLSRTNPPKVEATAADLDDGDDCLLNKRQVCAIANRTYPTIWDWMRRGLFPRARDVNGRPGWPKSEIRQWMTELPIARIKGDE
jgi:predicted DNA-binding transcriptional regulator AlpA